MAGQVEGYGLQPVHKLCNINGLAPDDCPSFKLATLPGVEICVFANEAKAPLLACALLEDNSAQFSLQEGSAEG
jgi:hypothetical protein